MKQFLSAAIFLGVAATLCAQSYYWSDERKIAVSEDRSSISFYLTPDAEWPTVETQLQQTEILTINYIQPTRRVVVWLRSDSRFTSESQLLESWGLSQSLVRDADFGLMLDDGFRIWTSDEVVLQLASGRSLADLDFYLKEYGAQFSHTEIETPILKMSQMKDALPLANALKESGLAKWAHPDFYAPITLYNDPLYPDQFQMNNTGQTINGFAGQPDCDVDAPEAWALNLGANVIVAVIDDGVENHEDLNDGSGNSRVLPGLTPSINGNGTPVLSNDGHGQACAGIIAASHNNLGVRGLAPQSQVISVNIFENNTGTQDIANGVAWAKNQGADVMSNSWGYTSCSAGFSNITNAYNDAAINGRGGKGCLVFFASGNGSKSCVDYPANIPSVIAVGAVTNTGTRSSYSNYGPTLDVVTPSNGAAGVRTIDRMGSNGYTFGNYTNSFGGTSAACPAAAGVGALLLSYDSTLTEAQARARLINNATDMGAPGFDAEYGFGRLSALDAILDSAPPYDPCNFGISNFPYLESFENGLGQWYQSFADDFDWSTRSGSTPSTGTGPSAAADGFEYIYMEASSPNYPSRTAILESPCFDLAGKSAAQFSFQYHTYGVNMGTLTLEASTNGGNWNAIWSTTGDQGNVWLSTTLNLDTMLGGTVRFRFSGITGSSFDSDMAIDDLQLLATEPFCALPIASFPYNEGFEAGLGDWSQSAADDFDWDQNSGGTPSVGTGPSAASEGNFYLYAEASFANHPSRTTTLDGPCFDLSAASSATFTFDYNMNGATMGTLELRATSDGLAYSNVWSKTGDQGAAWQNASVDLSAYLGDTLQLQFVATTGSGWESDIAIDDLELAASTSTTACANPGSLPHSEGFENTIGSWTQDANDDYDWIPYTGYTPTNRTGPKVPVDGTHYLYVEASKPNSPNKTGIIYSPCFDLSQVGAASFDFSYFMHGHFRMGSLILEGSRDGVSYDSLWSISGRQIAVWHTASVPLDTFVGGDLTLRFRAVTGTHDRGDMAIDAVSLTVGAAGSSVAKSSETAHSNTGPTEVASPKFSLFPNPTDGNATLLYESAQPQNTRLQVFSLGGKVLWQNDWRVSEGENKMEIPSQDWPAGIYILRFSTNEKSETIKLQVR